MATGMCRVRALGALVPGRALTLTLAATLMTTSAGCSLYLDFDKPPIDAAPDGPVTDELCMAFETNDTPGTALPITPGDYMAAICRVDTDYFKVTLDGTQTIVARINFENRNGAGDIDLRLLSMTGSTTIDESRTSMNEERVECPGGIMCNGALPAGDYLLQVLGFNAAVLSAYALHVEVGAFTPLDAGVN